MASSFSLLKAFIHDGCAGPLLLWGLSLAAVSGGLFLAVCGLLIVAAPLGSERRLQAMSFSSCTTWVHILRSRMHGSWALGPGLRCSKAHGVFLGLPGSGIEPASPALQADFLPPSHQFTDGDCLACLSDGCVMFYADSHLPHFALVSSLKQIIFWTKV